jgi:hypothetical protein
MAVIPTFYCPTRRPPRPINFNNNNSSGNHCGQAFVNHGTQRTGQTDYACSFASRGGNNSINNIFSRNGATVAIDCTVSPGPNGQPRGPGGRSCIGFEGIMDGTANVILYGEKRLNVRNLGNAQGDDNEGYTAALDQDSMRYTDLKPLPDRVTAGEGEWRFGSSHPATFNVVMCDGAVKGLSYRIESLDNSVFPTQTTAVPPVLTGNHTLFNKLGCRQDGYPAEPPN